ncbi:MAG: peptidyl-prolyl cis-trans isomerase [Desulfobacterales bacterium]|nr:MAG: peptidyl-prolyl cis-trans isomerase [Desulfobacterales bacterium]
MLKTLFLRLMLFLWLAGAALVNGGCNDEAVGNQGEAKTSESNVVAMVRGEAITTEDLETVLQKLPVRKREALRAKVLDNLIEARVFAEEARKEGLHKDPQVKEAVEKVTNEELARFFVKKRIDAEAEPSESAMKKYYTDNQDLFVVPDSVLLQQIVFKDEQKAKGALKSLQAGISFDALAKDESIAKSGKQGKPTWFYKGRMDPELEKAAFALEKDSLSDVIKTQKSYQIVKVLDTRDQKLFSFEDARFKIKQRLFWNKKRELIDKYYEAAAVNTHPTEPGVLVKIGEELITEETLAPILAKVSEKNKDKAKLRWIDYFIETKVFSKEARKVGLESDPEVAREIRRRTEKVLAQAFRKRFITGKFQVTDSDIAGHYESNPELFRVPEKVRAKSILVKTRQEAEDILKRLKGGASFGLLAQEKSLHPHASSRAGEIGWFPKGERDPAVEKAAFSLKKGEISDVIKTEAGYEIIKLMDKKGGEMRPLDEVEQSIKMTLTRQEFLQEKQHYYKKAGVKVTGT